MRCSGCELATDPCCRCSVAAATPIHWLDIDRPTRRASAARQTLQRQSLRLEMECHVVAAQSTGRPPNPLDREPHEVDCAAGCRRRMERPPDAVNTCVNHDRLRSNEPANRSHPRNRRDCAEICEPAGLFRSFAKDHRPRQRWRYSLLGERTYPSRPPPGAEVARFRCGAPRPARNRGGV
jgi:hypothetical protein